MPEIGEGGSHRQRGAGHDHRLEAVVDRLFQAGGDLQRGGAEAGDDPRAAADAAPGNLEPGAGLLIPGDEEAEIAGDPLQAPGNAAQVGEVRAELVVGLFRNLPAFFQQGSDRPAELPGLFFQLPDPAADRGPDFAAGEGRHHPVLDLLAFADRLTQGRGQIFADRLEGLERLLEKALAGHQQGFDAPVQVPVELVFGLRQLPGQGREQARQQTLVRLAGVAQLVEHPGEGEAGDLGGEEAGGHVLEVMGLVEDDPLEGWQDRGGRIVVGLVTQGQVREEQGVIDHQDVGLGGLAAGLVEKAAGVMGAAHPGALVDFAAHLFPDLFAGDEVQLLPRAVGGLGRPLVKGAEFGAQFGLEQPRFEPGGLHPAPAEIVAAPLDQHRPEIEAGGPLQKGDVLADQLLLQVDGVGRDHHPFLVGQRPEDGRRQVGQAFAGAGAGFDDPQLPLVEGLAHGKGHAQLLGALLVARQRCGHPAAGAENVVDPLGGQVMFLAPGKGLHHSVHIFHRVIHNVEADPERSELRGDFDVGARGVQLARGVVVNDHVAVAAALHNGGDRPGVAAGQHFHFADLQGGIGAAEKKDLIAPRLADGEAHHLPGGRGKALLHGNSLL